jgi:hypothetical protein
VGEEESVAVAALTEMVDGLIEAEPFRCGIGPIPSAEIESVGSCLQNDVTKYLLPCHSVSLGVGVRVGVSSWRRQRNFLPA